MRKCYIHIIYLTLCAIFSSITHSCDEERTNNVPVEQSSPKHKTIYLKASSMADIKDFLISQGINFKETVGYLDFDETAAKTVGTCQNTQFEFLSCPDRFRTYGSVYGEAFLEFNDPDFVFANFHFDELESENHESVPTTMQYVLLDQTTPQLIEKFKEEALFVGVCSALPGTDEKHAFMESIGLKRENFIFGGGSKPNAIKEHLQSHLLPKGKVSTVILIDNSYSHAIKPFLTAMPNFMCSSQSEEITFIGIEFTKFTDTLTKDAIIQELKALKLLLAFYPEVPLESSQVKK